MSKKEVLTVGFLIIFGVVAFASVSAGYDPGDEQTLSVLEDISDSVILGTVADIIQPENGNQFIINNILIEEIFVDKANALEPGEYIDVMTDSLFVSRRGEKIRKHNIPEIHENKRYIMYLRWDTSNEAFSPAAGESGIFEVDEQNKMLNLDGYYVAGVKNDKIIFGQRKKEPPAKTTISERPPSAGVSDIHGKRSVVLPSERKAPAIALEHLPDFKTFMNKALKEGKAGE